MKILYGVTGEGLGHAMRAQVIAAGLLARGHRVKIAASGRAARVLAEHVDDVITIDGLRLTYTRGGVARTRTALRTAKRAPTALARNGSLIRSVVAPFDPDVCLTDLDSFAHAAGMILGKPVVSLDHHHVIARCEHGPLMPRAIGADYRIVRAFVRAKLPGCAHYVVTSFYAPPVRDEQRASTTVVAPILRPEVLARRPTRGDHVVVYQTSTTHRRLLRTLGRLRDHRFVVYGYGLDEQRDNVSLRPFHPTRFLDDLASARAVICGGGHTAISEALHYGKPVMSIPLRGQGEQLLNAAYLERRHGGAMAFRPTRPDLERFLARAATMAPTPVAPGNDAALDALDRIFAEVA